MPGQTARLPPVRSAMASQMSSNACRCPPETTRIGKPAARSPLQRRVRLVRRRGSLQLPHSVEQHLRYRLGQGQCPSPRLCTCNVIAGSAESMVMIELLPLRCQRQHYLRQGFHAIQDSASAAVQPRSSRWPGQAPGGTTACQEAGASGPAVRLCCDRAFRRSSTISAVPPSTITMAMTAPTTAGPR